MNRFAGRVALVTGASRGIGLAVARRLAREGARVCVTARRSEHLTTAAQEIERAGRDGGVLTVAGDAADPAHQDETVKLVMERFGRIDVLVNNSAANPVFGPVLDLDDAAMNKILQTNVVAPVSWIRKVHAAWQGGNGGCVVNVAAVAGLRPIGGIGGYGASKAALIRLTEQLAIELAPGIRVNAVAPGVVKTRFARRLYDGVEEQVASRYPLKRLGEPGDVADLVAYLASDEAAWVTGQTVVVDGGLSLGESA
ncbi:MAG: SDR family oxidoreductase [Nonomuraea sp.]|nr:SDR family oxidoreductase [Nonomuraea sp.]NUP67404.1 SDR family oxidoreductase [Nonomuraea sp.]NUP83353.1 SDR family oxidoreductase [Nonomuraea sp.]NUS04763.1 SDR family oxidoreductase [Nonomuraea sp.]